MNRNKRNRCGLLNSGADENCRRCGIDLCSVENVPPRYVPEYPRPEPNPSAVTFGRFLVVLIVFAALGFAAYYAGVIRPEQIAAEKKRAQDEERSRKASDEIQKRIERENENWKREREYEKKAWEETKRKMKEEGRIREPEPTCSQGCFYRR